MVKIVEFANIDLNAHSNNIDKTLPWDVVEDLVVYMRNEPNFYRQKLYPAMLEVQDVVKKGKKFNKRTLMPIVDEAVLSYIKKYNIKKTPGELLSDSEKMQCISKILEDEVENFKKGSF
jgi:hypothetical protein